MDWLSYSPADLVPLSQETWLRLLADYNQAHLPVVAVGMALGLLLLATTAHATAARLRVALALFGACWLWIAWGFFHQALTPLLWAADWLAWGFAVQGALLLGAALLPMAQVVDWRWPLSPAWWLLAIAVLGLPLAGFAAGRPWQALGWLGTAPDPTAVATLALAAMAPGHRSWLLLAAPALWCLLSATLLAVFTDPLWWLPPAALAMTAVSLARRRAQHHTK